MTQVEVAFAEYVKALRNCCQCVELTALYTRICADSVRDVASYATEVTESVEEYLDSIRDREKVLGGEQCKLR